MERGGSRRRCARSAPRGSGRAGTRGACACARGCRGTPRGGRYIVARMTRFQGKTVLVTGGARGIGAATATRFASEGAKVVVADFDLEAAQETAAGIGGIAVRCDVTKRDEVEQAVEKAVAEGGSLDVLVTCAGIIRDNMLFKMSDEDWDAVIDT